MMDTGQLAGAASSAAYAQTAEKLARSSEIMEAHAALHEVVSSIEDRLDGHTERLGGVLRQVPQSIAESGNDRASTGVPVADEVLNHVARLRVIHERLVDLNHRLAL